MPPSPMVAEAARRGRRVFAGAASSRDEPAKDIAARGRPHKSDGSHSALTHAADAARTRRTRCSPSPIPTTRQQAGRGQHRPVVLDKYSGKKATWSPSPTARPCARPWSPRTRRARRWPRSRRMRAATCSNTACAASANAARNRAGAVHRSRQADPRLRGEVTRPIDTFRIAAGEATRIDGEVLELADLQAHLRLPRHGQACRWAPAASSPRSTSRSTWSRTRSRRRSRPVVRSCSSRGENARRRPDHRRGAGRNRPAHGRVLDPAVFERGCRRAGRGRTHRLAELHRRAGRLGPEGARGPQEGGAGTGGNAACIVDADPGQPLDAVVERLVFGAYYQSGQSCIGVQRIYAHAATFTTSCGARKPRWKTAHGRSARREDLHRTGDRRGRGAARRRGMDGCDAGGAKALVRGKRKGNMLPAALLENVPRDCDLYPQGFSAGGVPRTLRRFRRRHRPRQRQRFRPAGGVFTGDLAHAMRAWDGLEVGGVIVGMCRASAWTTCPTAGEAVGHRSRRRALCDRGHDRTEVAGAARSAALRVMAFPCPIDDPEAGEQNPGRPVSRDPIRSGLRGIPTLGPHRLRGQHETAPRIFPGRLRSRRLRPAGAFSACSFVRVPRQHPDRGFRASKEIGTGMVPRCRPFVAICLRAQTRRSSRRRGESAQ